MIKYVLAVDPGKVTGVSFFNRVGDADPELIWSKEVEQIDFAKEIRQVFSRPEVLASLDVVCERFIINSQTVRNSQAPYSLEQIGILKQCMFDVGFSADMIFFQAPADAMAMFTNEKLKKLGYWHRGGAGHALDSIRHAVLRFVKTGWKPVALLNN
jgi:hypothetical protein